MIYPFYCVSIYTVQWLVIKLQTAANADYFIIIGDADVIFVFDVTAVVERKWVLCCAGRERGNGNSFEKDQELPYLQTPHAGKLSAGSPD